MEGYSNLTLIKDNKFKSIHKQQSSHSMKNNMTGNQILKQKPLNQHFSDVPSRNGLENKKYSNVQ